MCVLPSYPRAVQSELMNAMKSRMPVDAQHNVSVKYCSVIVGGGNPC